MQNADFNSHKWIDDSSPVLINKMLELMSVISECEKIEKSSSTSMATQYVLNFKRGGIDSDKEEIVIERLQEYIDNLKEEYNIEIPTQNIIKEGVPKAS